MRAEAVCGGGRRGKLDVNACSRELESKLELAEEIAAGEECVFSAAIAGETEDLAIHCVSFIPYSAYAVNVEAAICNLLLRLGRIQTLW